MFKVGIIGVGNMGEAIVRGFLNKKIFKSDEIIVSDVSQERLDFIINKYGVAGTKDNKRLANLSEIIILAVKPKDLEKTVKQILYYLNFSKILISVLAGISIKKLRDLTNEEIKIVRVMPNTPALVGEGVIAVSFDEDISNKSLNETEKEYILKILSALGEVYQVKEDLMDCITALSGSGPAYIFNLIDAMAQGGVKQGLTYDLALKLATQTVLGSAKLLKETKEHPAILRDKVSSPAGTTIYALHKLEKNGFKNAIIEAIEEATKRSKELGNNRDRG